MSAVAPIDRREPAASRAPSAGYALLRIFDLSISSMLWSRRTVFMGLVVGLPVLIAAVLRGLVAIGLAVQIGQRGITGPLIFGYMIWGFFIRFSVPILSVFYGTSLIADEIEDKTITYLFTRPIPRGAVLLGKYLAYLVCTVFVVLPAVVLVWLLIEPIGARLGAGVFDLMKDLVILAAGLAVYGAVFALVGVTFKRPLLSGLIFVFGWETFALALPGYLKHFTVAYYVQGLVPQAMPGDSALAVLQALVRESPTVTESVVWLGVIGVGCLWLAARTVGRREYVLDQ